MANSRNSTPADAERAVVTAISAALAAHVPLHSRVAVGLSGGMDSMVLLDALVLCAASHSLRLSAIHVHHGISRNADAWTKFCAEQCTSRGVAFAEHRLDLDRKSGQSLEAIARNARYQSLMAADADVVALAHHADDQAETLLLQLLRGAGPRGISAMPAYREARPALLRPLLALPRRSLASYAKSRGLAWIEDESNTDPRHKRNALRNEIAPRIAKHFAGYPETLARAASHQAEASVLLDELAAGDAAPALGEHGLERGLLARLSPARASNVLRWFLRREGLRAPSEARLAEMLRQLGGGIPGARTRIAHDGAEIGCHRGRVVVHLPATDAFSRRWQGEAEVRLPGGVLTFEHSEGSGIAAVKIDGALVTLRSRIGGERIRLASNRPRRSVKKLLQDAKVSQWQRLALPLVWCGDQLAAIPGIGVDLAFQAADGEPSWRISWHDSHWEHAADPGEIQ
jgi:tRNA(Ile)-lysidine synthase